MSDIKELTQRSEGTEISKGMPTRPPIRSKSRLPTPCSTPRFGAKPKEEVDDFVLRFSREEDIHHHEVDGEFVYSAILQRRKFMSRTRHLNTAMAPFWKARRME